MPRSSDFPVVVAYASKANAGLITGSSVIAAQPSVRIEMLDFFRGIAIFMVVCGHFFLLVGHLIFKSLQNCNISTFLCRRFFKIFPAFWLNVLILFIASYLGLGLTNQSSVTYLANFLMVSDLLRLPNINNVYWTLLIEVKFYVFIAVYFHLLRNRFVFAVPLLITFTNVAVFLVRGQASQLLTFFPIFFVGIQVFLSEKSGSASSNRIWLVLTSLLAGLNLVLFEGVYPLWSLGYVLGGAAMVGLLTSGFSTALLAFYGKVSYSIYLYHTLVGYSLFEWIGRQPTVTGNLMVVFSVLVLTTLIAYLPYTLVDSPSVRFYKTHERQFLNRFAKFWKQ